jgi:hypothetical protein
MRIKLLALALLLVSFVLVMTPSDGLTQIRGGGKGGGPGGMMGGGFDPSRMFEMFARGKDSIQISDMRMFRTQLEEYAREKGITNGQITREQFAGFGEQMKAKMASGDFSFIRPGGGSSGTPMTVTVPGSSGAAPVTINVPNMTESAGRYAELEFGRRDKNSDGTLNYDEVPGSLRDEFLKWDTNQNNQIELSEFTNYFTSRMQERVTRDAQKAGFNPIIIEQEPDRRPVVYRAGALPKDLPPWYGKLDSDRDGQIALYEWRKDGRELGAFKGYDRNGDGFLTAEEVLWTENVAKNGNGGISATTTTGRQMVTGSRGPGQGGGDWRANFGKGGFGPGGFGKGRKGGG